MSECPFRETCARMGGICQCAEEIQQDDEDRRRSEHGDCWYCQGARALCTCTEDCGARPEPIPGNSHVCGKAPAEVIRAWLRETGLYSEEEIQRQVP